MNKVEDLIIWQKAMILTKKVYIIVSDLPQDERFGLTSQIKRSSVSIPSNIAEGAGRNSNKEFKYSMSIANGSTYELETQLRLLVELKLIAIEKIQPLIDLCIEIEKMNYTFQKRLS